MDGKDLTFVDEADAITGDYDPETKCVRMSCGHAVDRQSLASWCLAKLPDRLHQALTCPASQCGKLWSYGEVRRVALLTDEEKKKIEVKLSEFAMRASMDVKECPSCRSFIERKDRGSYRVVCKVCADTLGRPYAFCWNCEKEWTADSSSLKCGSSECTHPLLHLVRDCTLEVTIDGITFPARRACPRCGVIVEHNGQGCKNISCPKCGKSFCMSCLAQSCGSCSVKQRQQAIPES